MIVSFMTHRSVETLLEAVDHFRREVHPTFHGYCPLIRDCAGRWCMRVYTDSVTVDSPLLRSMGEVRLEWPDFITVNLDVCHVAAAPADEPLIVIAARSP